MNSINVGKDFGKYLTNRDDNQGDGRNNAVQFRKKYLSELDDQSQWNDDTQFISLNFEEVEILGPSWANEAFAYFTKYKAKPERILSKIKFEEISEVKLLIIKEELDAGYYILD